MTERTKHTPGPWEAQGVYVAQVDSPVTIAEVDSRSTARRVRRECAPDLQTAYANARLLAAAPEMLEALREMVEFYAPDCGEDCKIEEHGPAGKARAAIAAAEGRDA